MASDEGITQYWCHLHSQDASQCRYGLCQLRANDPSYAGFANEELLNTTGFGTMEEGSTGLNEVYESHRAAGFGPQQALWLLAAMVTGSPGPVPDDDGPGAPR